VAEQRLYLGADGFPSSDRTTHRPKPEYNRSDSALADLGVEALFEQLGGSSGNPIDILFGED